MQRNVRNEIMIAIGAVLIIAFGLVFAVLLTGTDEQGDATPTETNAPVVTLAETERGDASPSEEVTEVVAQAASEIPTETDTEIPPSDTVEPTDTAEPTATYTLTTEPTATDIPPSNTPTLEPTNTEIPASNTPEFSPTPRLTGRATRAATATEEEATATNTRPPTNTPSPTATKTPRPSNTPVPTATDTRRPTNTPSPSATNTRPPTITPSPTATLRPSATPTSRNAMTGIIPTPPPSPTVLPTNQPSRTPSNCQLPQGWTSYTVQSGNTLFAIALATNSTVAELRDANCIENIDNITTGDVIFVPRAPLRPVATFVPSGIRDGLNPIGCQTSSVIITSPISAQHLNGTFAVYGSAARSDFLYYKLEIRPDGASIYNFYMNSYNQVTNGVLGEINSELFGTGLHWVKLTMVDIHSTIPVDASCEIPVIFD
jgi:LysM repeat protein